MARALSAAANRLFGLRLFSVLAWNLDELRETAAASPGARVLHADELEAASREPELDLNADFVASALAHGHVCVGAEQGGQLASYCWLSGAETYMLDGLSLVPPARSRYVYKAFTSPRHRGRGLLGSCLEHAGRTTREQGGASLVTVVERWNRRSIRAFEARGFRRAGHLLIGSRPSFLFASSGCQRLGLGFVRKSVHS